LILIIGNEDKAEDDIRFSLSYYCEKCRVMVPFTADHECPEPKNGYKVINHKMRSRVKVAWLRLNWEKHYQYRKINRFWRTGPATPGYRIINFEKRIYH